MGLFKQFREQFWTPDEPWRSVRAWAVPRFFEAWHSTLCCTLRVTTTGFSRGMPLAFGQERGALLICWHDKTLMPLHVLRDLDLAVMISTSRAGQLQGAFWARLGWRPVWGSTKKREGILALREALRLLRDGQSFAFSPDGPKGPRHKAQGGVVYMSSHAGAPILPIGVAASRGWTLPTWDRHFVPKPFSRVHLHMGEPIQLPPDIPKTEMPRYIELVENALEAAEREAEQRLKLWS